MKKCESCIYSEIYDWEQEEKTGKANPIYWCERYIEFCKNIRKCEHAILCAYKRGEENV